MDVFVSYARTEKPRVARLVKLIEDAGYTVWWDAQMKVSSKAYTRQITEELAKAKAVLVCWSPDAVESDWVLSEASAARESRKLVQALIRPCAPPPPFDVLEIADLRGRPVDPDPAQWARVIEEVATLAMRPPARAAAKPRRPWMFPAAAAALLLAAAGVALFLARGPGGPSGVSPATPAFTAAAATSPAPSEPAGPPMRSAAASSLPTSCSNPDLAPVFQNLMRAGGRSSVRMCVDGACDQKPIRLGENMQLEVQSEVAGALIALDIDEKGDVSQLLPNTYAGGSPRIGRGEVRRVPESGFTLTADEVERGCIVVVIGPTDSSFERLATRADVITRGFKVVDAKSTGEIAAVIAQAAAANPDMPDWAFSFAVYEIVK